MPQDSAALAAIMRTLYDGNALPLPADEPWDGMIRRISTLGVNAVVTEETYDYFLNVLPPRWMGSRCYGFAEGEEALRVFWKAPHGEYFCRQLTWEETVSFCAAAGIRTPY